ncbi:MAG: hypothetical protein NTX65_09090 [Ignavibacteriales bacterium]|nr:hypothetical protein [Ignavibacteriales bacterium]
MKSLKEAGQEHLSWTQPKATHQSFELRIKDDLFGTLIFPKSVGSLAEAETFEGKWTFKRVGFFSTRITVRKSGEEIDIAAFKPNLMATTGILEFSNGKKYHWHSANFWETKFEFKDGEGETVVTFRSGVDEPKLKDWFKTQARVEIAEHKNDLPELSIILLLGWYLIIVLQMDSSAGAVVAVAS